MEHANTAALDFLRPRRSHPPKLLRGPAPSEEALTELLQIAARVPDHGKLEPWRFILLQRQTLDRLAPLLAEAVLAAGGDATQAEKASAAFASPVIVAVVSSPVASPKIPEWEQFLSAGNVCFSLLNAALAAGYGAAWLTGPATQPEFGTAHLGLQGHERIVGLIHIGQRGDTPPERPRPDLASKVSVL